MPFINKSYILMLERQNAELREDVRRLTNVICSQTGRLVPFHQAVNPVGHLSSRKTIYDLTRELEAQHAVTDDEVE
jgi:hypothetical protein